MISLLSLSAIDSRPKARIETHNDYTPRIESNMNATVQFKSIAMKTSVSRYVRVAPNRAEWSKILALVVGTALASAVPRARATCDNIVVPYDLLACDGAWTPLGCT